MHPNGGLPPEIWNYVAARLNDGEDDEAINTLVSFSHTCRMIRNECARILFAAVILDTDWCKGVLNWPIMQLIAQISNPPAALYVRDLQIWFPDSQSAERAHILKHLPLALGAVTQLEKLLIYSTDYIFNISQLMRFATFQLHALDIQEAVGLPEFLLTQTTLKSLILDDNQASFPPPPHYRFSQDDLPLLRMLPLVYSPMQYHHAQHPRRLSYFRCCGPICSVPQTSPFTKWTR